MKIIFLLFAAAFSLSVTAQTVQNGLIKEYNEKTKKTPLPGVELNVRSANSTVSDKSGHFSLQFLTLKPGEKVNVRRIEKLGYEIFNKEAVEQWNINPKTPFVILMCRSDRFKRIRDNYEKVSSASYARQLKKDENNLAKLKAEGKLKEIEYQKKLFGLRESYEKQLDNIDSYVDRFSRIDLSEISAVEQEIIDLVQQGEIDKAIEKYEQQNYVDKYATEVAQIKNISSAINQLSDIKESKEQSRDSILAAIDRQIETLKLAGGKENFDKIGTILKNLAESDINNTLVYWKYIEYLRDQNAHEILSQSIDLFLNLEISSVQRMYGLEVKLQNQICRADFAGADATAKALNNTILECIADSCATISDISKCYFRIGGLYMECRHPEIAREFLEKSINIYPNIDTDDDINVLNTAIQYHVGYAACNYLLGKTDVCSDITNNVYRSVSGLLNTTPSISYIPIAKALTDLGQLCDMIKEPDKASILYDFCESIYSNAIKNNPRHILPLLANLNIAKAIMYQNNQNFDMSEKFYLKGLELHGLMEQYNLRNTDLLSVPVYNNLSLLYLKNNKKEKALSAANNAFDIIYKRYTAEPYFYRSQMFHNSISLGRIYQAVGNITAAEEKFCYAFEIDKTIFQERGDNYKAVFWKNSIDLPLFYLKTEQYEKSIIPIEYLVSLGESFIVQGSDLFMPHQKLIYFLGRSYRITGDYTNAERVLTKFINQNPENFLGHLEMARVQAHFGNSNSVHNHIQSALNLNKNALYNLSKDDILMEYISE